MVVVSSGTTGRAEDVAVGEKKSSLSFHFEI